MITQDIQTLRQRFADAWVSDVPVFFDLQLNEERPTNSAYCHFSVRPGYSERYLLGGKTLQQGRVWFHIFVPPQTGDKLAYELIDQFAEIYRNWISADYAIECFTEEVKEPVKDKNGMVMMCLSIRYESVRIN